MYTEDFLSQTNKIKKIKRIYGDLGNNILFSSVNS